MAEHLDDNQSTYRVAVVKWGDSDGIADAICQELLTLGHAPVCFRFDARVPERPEVLFTFAPYGRLLQIARQFAECPQDKRPIVVHWNFESLPNIRIPWGLLGAICGFRSWVDRMNDCERSWIRRLVQTGPLSTIDKRMQKFRFQGDYQFAHRQGWIDLLFDSSEILARMRSMHGLPSRYVPWGTSTSWYADLGLERDIDVLWLGKRRTRRRGKLLERLKQQLSALGVRTYIADNVENPFIYGEARTRFLNRARITLNLLPTWYDPGFPFRFHLAAGNKSLVVSDPLLPHAPVYEAGEHYVSAPAESIVETILYYLQHEDERKRIAQNAYQLVTERLTLTNSIGMIMQSVRDFARARGTSRLRA